jgi:hypothetical protein
MNNASFLDAIWRRNLAPPDRRPIWQWAAEEGTLPSCYAITGRLDVAPVPFVRDPLAALGDPRVREVVCQSAVQCCKTLVGELWLLWTICENPGPTQWLQPTDEEAHEHAQERFLHLVENFPVVHRFYTGNRHDRLTTFINFSHMWLRMEGAENLGNLQRKSVKNQMCSEVWMKDRWKPGHLKQAASRLTQFDFASKRYIESQAGEAGDDMDEAWRAGDQSVWHFGCLNCGHLQPYAWSVIRPDGTRAGMRWEDSDRIRRPDGQWRWGELAATVRYECRKCGHAHADDARTRRLMNDAGKYISLNPEAPATTRSFAWNQLAMPNLGWFESRIGGVKNFLLAHDQAKKGYDLPQKEFFQKVLAEPYDPERFAHFDRLPTVEISTPAPDTKKFWDKQTCIFLSVDVQMDHFWGLVSAWSAAGDDCVLWAGKLITWDDVAAKQQEYYVPDQDVSVDAKFRQNEVYRQCASHGHWETDARGVKYWFCWKALKGDDRAEFIYIPKRGPQKGRKLRLPYSWPPASGDPCLGLASDDPARQQLIGRFCPVIFWSNPTIKDVAGSRRDNMARGIQSILAPGNWNDELSRQMFSEQRKSVTNTLGQQSWKWMRLGKRPNHLWDCYCMTVARAFMKRLLGGDLAAPAPPN